MKKKVKHMLSKLLLPLAILSCNHALSKACMNMPNPASVTSEENFLKKGEKNGALWWFDSNERGARSKNLKEAIRFAKEYNCDRKEVLKIWRRYHNDEALVSQKLNDFNEKLIEITDDFKNCYGDLHNIKLSIDDWYKKIENSNGFDVARTNAINQYKRRGVCGGSWDAVTRYMSGKQNDEKSNEFRSKLLRDAKKSLNKLNNTKDKIDKLISDFERTNILKKNIPSEMKDILISQQLVISELKKFFNKTEIEINKWKKFLNEQNFYEHKVHCGCRFRYSEEFLDYDTQMVSESLDNERKTLKEFQKQLKEMS